MNPESSETVISITELQQIIEKVEKRITTASQNVYNNMKNSFESAINELIQQNTQLKEEMSVVKNNQEIKPLKLPTIEFFTRDRTKLQGFLTQIALWIKKYKHSLKTEEDKIKYIKLYLRDKAYNWYEPYLRQYLNSLLKN